MSEREGWEADLVRGYLLRELTITIYPLGASMQGFGYGTRT